MLQSATDVEDGPMARFSNLLRQALTDRYGHLPSATFVAREFNLRHKGARTISSESVRRWLQGRCLPRIERLQTISAWLGLRMDAALSLYHGQTPHEATTVRPMASRGLVYRESDTLPRPLSLNEEQRRCLKRILITLYPELDLESLRAAFAPDRRSLGSVHAPGKPR